MSQRNTFVRALHDLGGAAWFGGTLMGAVGLNGGATAGVSSEDVLTVSSAGWARWAPVQWAAIAAHGVGGIGLILGNKSRLAGQSESRTNTAVKSILTFAAVGTTIWSGLAGAAMAKHRSEGADGVTEPGSTSSDALASAQRQQKILQWATPVLTGIVLILGSQQGEQQRPVAGPAGR
jgi:hypothetical protein